MNYLKNLLPQLNNMYKFKKSTTNLISYKKKTIMNNKKLKNP